MAKSRHKAPRLNFNNKNKLKYKSKIKDKRAQKKQKHKNRKAIFPNLSTGTQRPISGPASNQIIFQYRYEKEIERIESEYYLLESQGVDTLDLKKIIPKKPNRLTRSYIDKLEGISVYEIYQKQLEKKMAQEERYYAERDRIEQEFNNIVVFGATTLKLEKILPKIPKNITERSIKKLQSIDVYSVYEEQQEEQKAIDEQYESEKAIIEADYKKMTDDGLKLPDLKKILPEKPEVITESFLNRMKRIDVYSIYEKQQEKERERKLNKEISKGRMKEIYESEKALIEQDYKNLLSTSPDFNVELSTILPQPPKKITEASVRRLQGISVYDVYDREMLKRQYAFERERITESHKNLTYAGKINIALDSILPKQPKRITQASLNRLQKIDVYDIYARNVKLKTK